MIAAFSKWQLRICKILIFSSRDHSWNQNFSLSVLTAIFQVDRRYQNVSILDFSGARDDEGDGDNWSYVMQNFSQIVTTNKPTPSVLQVGCTPYRPTNSVRALKEEKLAFAHQILSKSDNLWLRYSNKTIFTIAAVRHIGFIGTSSYCIWLQYFTFLTLC